MQYRHEQYAAKMREASRAGKPIRADRPSQSRLDLVCWKLDALSSRLDALEERLKVLGALEERIRILDAEHEAMQFAPIDRARIEVELRQKGLEEKVCP